MPFRTSLIDKAERYVRNFINENCSDKMFYHNIYHTEEVVKAAEKIGKKCQLSDEDLEIVILAAWFHDTGYYKGNEDHEIKSAEIADNFFSAENTQVSKLEKVKNCIKATKIPQCPNNLIEKVLCDADLYHLSSNKFFKKSELLRKELVAHQCAISPVSWMSKSCEFISRHKYFTDFAKRILKPKKEANLKKLELKINRQNGTTGSYNNLTK